MVRAEAFAGDPVNGGADPTGLPRVRGLGGTAGGAAAAVSRAPDVEVGPAGLARDRCLPVLPALETLVPGPGLRRGTTVGVSAAPGVAGTTSLALALAAGASQAGSWVAAIGLESLGLVAAAELGVALERLVLVADPGRDREGWAPVVGALVDGFDVVLVAAPERFRPADARRLVARVRERGAVLVAVGGDLPGERSPLGLTVTAARWEGLGHGWGRLEGRRMMVEAGGRGEAARARRAELWLPAEGGGVGAAEALATPIPLQAVRDVGRSA